jgi:hypothetical protein
MSCSVYAYANNFINQVQGAEASDVIYLPATSSIVQGLQAGAYELGKTRLELNGKSFAVTKSEQDGGRGSGYLVKGDGFDLTEEDNGAVAMLKTSLPHARIAPEEICLNVDTVDMTPVDPPDQSG